MTAPLKATPSVLSNGNLEALRGQKPQGMEEEKLRLRKATQEFESFFMYYMLKNMRKSIPNNPFGGEKALGGGMGKDMFTDLFDMEVSRRITSGSERSISAMLYNSLEKLVDVRHTGSAPEPEFRPVEQPANREFPVEREPSEIPRELERPIDIPSTSKGLELPGITRQSQPESVAEKYGRFIDRAAAENHLDSALIASVIEVESSGDPRAVSPAGAKGLMQLTDSTAREMGVTQVFDPEANIRGGSRYLRKMLDRYGDLEVALAAYNAGPSRVDRHGGVPPFKETQSYIARVTSNLAAHGAQIGRVEPKVWSP